MKAAFHERCILLIHRGIRASISDTSVRQTEKIRKKKGSKQLLRTWPENELFYGRAVFHGTGAPWCAALFEGERGSRCPEIPLERPTFKM